MDQIHKLRRYENLKLGLLEFIVCLFQSRDVICFIIGGVTYEESFHIYRLNKELAGKIFGKYFFIPFLKRIFLP
jgi:hypothetical protein